MAPAHITTRVLDKSFSVFQISLLDHKGLQPPSFSVGYHNTTLFNQRAFWNFMKTFSVGVSFFFGPVSFTTHNALMSGKKFLI